MQTIGFHNTDDQQTASTPWTADYRQGATIFGRHTYLPIDYRQAKNDNTLVVGSSGTGKTYSFVEPNVLSANANYVIADAKGDILADTGMSLRAQGYRLQVLNLVDLKHSMTYNPLAYMHSQLDVVAFAHQVIGADITGDDHHRGFDDPFWTNAPATLLEALIMFTKEFLPASEQTMGTVTRLFELVDRTDEDVDAVLASLGYSGTTSYQFDHDEDEYGNDVPVSLGERLFAWVAKQDPRSGALRLWNSVEKRPGAALWESSARPCHRTWLLTLIAYWLATSSISPSSSSLRRPCSSCTTMWTRPRTSWPTFSTASSSASSTTTPSICPRAG